MLERISSGSSRHQKLAQIRRKKVGEFSSGIYVRKMWLTFHGEKCRAASWLSWRVATRGAADGGFILHRRDSYKYFNQRYARDN